MAATLDPPSKSWWTKAKSQSGPAMGYSPEKPKSKSLGSLFGRKTKKQAPSLAIQDPHLPIQSVPPLEPRQPQSFANRPPSKSVSSTRSRADSVEPRTPSDTHHHQPNIARQSLLTLSDIDPFASGRSISIIASPSLPTDPTRLSAYSNTSSNDRKHGDSLLVQRTSYASSSSHSQNHGNGSESPLPVSPVLHSTHSTGFQEKLRTKRSDSALNRNGGQPSPTHIDSGTSTNLSFKVSSRPPTRPRGLTDNCSTQKSGFFVDMRNHSANAAKPADSQRSSSSHRPSNASSSRSPTVTSPRSPPFVSPRVVVRQASLQHIRNPAPPPTHRLPAPPQSPDVGISAAPPQTRRLHSNSTASSTVSHGPTALSKDISPSPALVSPPPPPIRPRRVSDRNLFASSTPETDKERPAERRKPSLAPLSPPMTLKKALSHQSLLKRGPFSSTASSDTPTAVPSHDSEKPHKHRFPHPRIPMPSFPLKHANTSASTLADTSPHPPTHEQKRSSTSSGRKRLFSGSSLRRPSTSQSVAAVDEDNQSVFSMKSDQDMYINTSFFKPWISTQPSHPSFWDEASADTFHTSVRGTPDPAHQPVSPVLGRLELTRDAPPIAFTSATLTGGTRQRGFSVRSSSTMASIDDKDSVLSGLSPRSQKSDHHSRFHRSNTITSSRGASNNQNKFDTATGVPIGRPRTATNASTTSKRISSDRPSSAQPTVNGETKFSDVAFEQSFFSRSSSSPPPVITSLPPPPRPRTRANITPQQEAALPAKPTVIALSAPPPPRRPRPKMSFEKVLHRRSLMKKPSFLLLDDDDDDDDDVDDKDEVVRLFEDERETGETGERGQRERRVVDNSPLPVSESFLDFARESFDTIR